MTIHRTKTILGLSLALLTTAACAANEDEPSVAETEQALDEGAVDQAGDDAPDAHHPHARDGRHGPRRKGPDKVLWTALEELDLSDAQRSTIEEIARGLHERPAPSPAMETRRKALADAIRAGDVDVNAFAAKPDDGPMKAMHAKMVAAIDELHATLSAEQRTELASILKERHEARAAKWAAKKAKRGERGERGKRKHARGPSGMVLRGLDVTDAQRAEIETALAEAGLDGHPDRDAMKGKWDEMKARRAAMLEAFASDDFEAASQLPPPREDMANHHARFIQTLAVVAPLLDADQRAALADRIEQGPKHFGKRGKPGKRGRRGAMRR